MTKKQLSKTQERLSIENRALVEEIRGLIESARSKVAATANAEITLLYWQIGKRIGEETLKGGRAEYGKEILVTLAQQLTHEYGRGYSYSALTRMVRFAEVFPKREILATLSQTLTWSHFTELLPLEKPLQRDFYTEMCRVERWSVRTLRKQINSMLFERTALSKKPDELAKKEIDALKTEDKMSPGLVFKDPYLLDFLGLKDTFWEKDLEHAILREMESFIMELGAGFTFVERQKRITVDDDDFYLDLLFYNRDLRRLVAVELKLEKFRPAHKGQMELYLRWLDKHERRPDEDSPLGIVLCAVKKNEQIELLELGQSGIHVAEYLTVLPDRKLLQQKLQQAITIAKEKYRASQFDRVE